jgi:Tol biopolymer transport system component
VAFVPPASLLFVRRATLVAQRFDLARLELEGEPIPLAEDVVVAATALRAAFAAGGRTLVYRTGGFGEARLLLLDRSSKEVSTLDGPNRYPANPSISPDGTRVAIARLNPVEGTSDIWIVDIARRVSSRFTTHPGWELAPLWSKDGLRIAFASNREGSWDVYERDIETGPGDEGHEVPLVRSRYNQHPQTWSPSGDLIYAHADPATGPDLWTVNVERHRGPEPILTSQFTEREADLSPDGHWLAYVSDESGASEVYVRRFPSGSDKQRISPSGGAEPRWRDDGSELFYVGGDRRLRAVTLGGGGTVKPSSPTVLIDMRISDSFWWDYAVAPGGQRFVIKQAINEGRSSPLNVILDWSTLLSPARR